MGGEMYRAGLPVPGARLLAAASLVRRGGVVADIGCDHGKLAVYLAMTGHAERVIAVDKNPLPLGKARALVAQTGCAGRVECRLGDGLQTLEPGEAQDIVMAGMGGELMTDILQAAEWTKDKGLRLVFVPATRAAHLRRWLLQNGFELRDEIAVEERRRFYTAFAAEYSGRREAEPDALVCEIGLLAGMQRDGAALGYIRTRAGQLRNKLGADMPAEERQALCDLIDEVEACLA